ncbi:leucyl aminopeptidase [bacterium]|nr:leucyl aminopeptidase [bacterium]
MLELTITAKSSLPEETRTDALLWAVPEGKEPPRPLAALDRKLGGMIADLYGFGDFEGKKKTHKVLYTLGRIPARRLILVGVGKREEQTVEGLRESFVSASASLLSGQTKTAALVVPTGLGDDDPAATGAALSGIALRLYQFLDYKTGEAATRKGPTMLTLLVPPKADLAAFRALAEREEKLAQAVSLTRDVANTPGMEMTPARFAEVARTMCRKRRLKCEVLLPAEMKKRGMNAHLAVGQGSKNEPRVVIMTYSGGKKRDAPICLVGKGLTFDSGGLCIKNADKMDLMKFDMCGAASVLGAMQALADLGIKRNVIGICAMAENMPDGGAYRPGDVLRSMSGQTIEVVNTDAEGRLVLADNLYLASRYKPAAIVDLATLTGSVVVALGTQITGLFSNRQPLAEQLLASAQAEGEGLWRMPTTPQMMELLKSEIADVKHAAGRWGGCCTAATFLSRFVDNRPWAHLDIAAACFSEGDLKGADGRAVRTLIGFICDFEPID